MFFRHEGPAGARASLAIPSPQSRTTAGSAMSSRASLYARLGRAAEARADLERALQLSPLDWDQRPAIEKRLKSAV